MHDRARFKTLARRPGRLVFPARFWTAPVFRRFSAEAWSVTPTLHQPPFSAADKSECRTTVARMGYYNLSPEQHAVQRLVDQWNADERLWQKLELRRRLRRARRKNLTEAQLRELDLREFAIAKHPADCIGQPLPA